MRRNKPPHFGVLSMNDSLEVQVLYTFAFRQIGADAGQPIQPDVLATVAHPAKQRTVVDPCEREPDLQGDDKAGRIGRPSLQPVLGARWSARCQSTLLLH